MKKKDLEEMLDLSDDYQFNEEVSKKIKKGINKNVNIRVLKILLCLCIIISGLWAGTSFMFKQFNYNPKNEKGITAGELDNESLNEYADFKVLLQTFIGFNFPGLSFVSAKEEDNGGGNYKIYVNIQDMLDLTDMYGEYNLIWSIRHSKLGIEEGKNVSLGPVLGEFREEDNGDPMAYKISEEALQDVRDLPDSAYLSVSLSFNEIKNAKEFIEFINKYNSSYFSWAAVKSNYKNNVTSGMTLWQAEDYNLSEDTQKSYPSLYLPSIDKITEDILLENYLSNLKLLIDHPDFLEVMNVCSMQSIDSYRIRYDEAKTSGIQFIGVKGWIKKTDLLKMIEKDGFKYIGNINDVKLTDILNNRVPSY